MNRDEQVHRNGQFNGFFNKIKAAAVIGKRKSEVISSFGFKHHDHEILTFYAIICQYSYSWTHGGCETNSLFKISKFLPVPLFLVDFLVKM
jgi:hypothetical protein